MRLRSALTIGACPLLLTAVASSASAQVHLTEVYYDSTVANDLGEFVELQNTGTAAQLITDWTLNDYTGSAPDGVSATTWAFPAAVTLAPGQVIVVARDATAFATEFPGSTADYEYPTAGADNANVPNLIPAGGTTQMQMANSSDAVVLLNDTGVQQSWCEWGNVDRNLPGTPTADVPAGTSLLRIGTAGNSSVDFVGGVPSPGVGIMAQPPTIALAIRSPASAVFGGAFSTSATVSDADGVAGVEVYFATATALAGPAAANYQVVAATQVGSQYTVSGSLPNIAPGITFADPTLFNERYIRYFFFALDNQANGSELPVGATTVAGNPSFFWENVLPTTAVYTVAQARAQGVDEVPLFEHHSIRVQGVVLTQTEAFQNGRTNFFIADAAGADAIRVFDDDLIPQSVQPGDLVQVVGKIGVFRGVRQIGRDERTDAPAVLGPEITVTMMGTAVVPMATVTVAAMLGDGEGRESQLLEIANATLVNAPDMTPPPATWPADGTVYVDDGTGTLAVRIVGSTDLPGNATPTGAFTLRGILTQFAPNGTGGYQLQPRNLTDIVGGPPPMDGGVDGGLPGDTGMPGDTGNADGGLDGGPADNGTPDTGMPGDTGNPADSGPDAGRPDSGVRPDAGSNPDTGVRPDAGTGADAGDGGFFGGGTPDDSGCGCSGTPSSLPSAAWGWALLALAIGWRRRR